MVILDNTEVRGQVEGRLVEILSPAAIKFVASLQREFGPRRVALLRARQERQVQLDSGELPRFLDETRSVRDGDWQVAPAPADLEDRRVEITGPVDRKMMINALNSGAKVFLADFEDALSPTWDNLLQGQANLIDAVEGTITLESPERTYRLNEQVATLMLRPRGWHLPEKHLWIDHRPVSASLFDFGLSFFHTAQRRLNAGSGPYYYLPKLEGHQEARLWNDVFLFAQAALGIPPGSVRATVLIETILAAFEMEEILYELREHSGGLNAGRWDYIFSSIKKLRNQHVVLPDRAQVTMTVPFMRGYSELLVKTCHRRGAHAIGGMAAFIPSRRNAQINELALAKVREDKLRESGDGFDGTWVAHPDLVPVARAVFDAALGDRPNQVERQREDVRADAATLLDLRVPGGQVSEEGLRNNISVALQYLAAWLGGTGAVAIFNLMEDAATAEIARAQVWQWIHSGVPLADGRLVTRGLVQSLEQDELAKIRHTLGEDVYAGYRFAEATNLFEQLALSEDFADFLTLPAYEILEPTAD